MQENKQWPRWQNFLNFNTENKIQGGLRLQGLLKETSEKTPLISYVTVIRNNEKDIRRVIESVQKQTYKNIEHILLDGASTDKTLSIIQEYSDIVDYFASEPDKGLYDALNKAIPLCRGDLICVLNSDDWLPENAAEIVVQKYNKATNTLLLGAAKVQINETETIKWVPGQVTKNSYFSIANCCHNAMYATKGTYELSGPYDTNLKIAADFKWIMRCFDAGVKFINIDDITVHYSLGGISSDSVSHIKECKFIAKEKFPFLTAQDIDELNYIFYPWRDHLDHLRFGSLQLTPTLQNLTKKYHNNSEFIQSITIQINTFINKNKTYLIKRYINNRYPLLYSKIRTLFHLLKELKLK